LLLRQSQKFRLVTELNKSRISVKNVFGAREKIAVAPMFGTGVMKMLARQVPQIFNPVI